MARPVLVLIGGGHAHLGVLADWTRHGSPDARCILLTPDRQTRYSGMIPGIVAGRYDEAEGLIDLGDLTRSAGIELILGRCTGIDPIAKIIRCDGGSEISFDLCSIDTGGVASTAVTLAKDPRVLDVRPIGTFLSRLAQWEREQGKQPGSIIVAGGGAGGVELAFALRARTSHVSLVAGQAGLLPGLSRRARELAMRELERQDIRIFIENLRSDGDRYYAGQRLLDRPDLVVASMGAGAPGWPAASGLAVDGDGFVAVDRHQRSTSHPDIFAAGDVAKRMDRAVDHSGVHAVHTGPILAHNLRCAIEKRGAMRSYRPRPTSLYLLSTADGRAIATYGPLAAHGRWASRLKHRIDTRWVESFAKMGVGV